MHTYLKLRDGTIYVIWSDNIEEETMNVYKLEDRFTFDASYDDTKLISYSDILIIDSNLSVVQNWSIKFKARIDKNENQE